MDQNNEDENKNKKLKDNIEKMARDVNKLLTEIENDEKQLKEKKQTVKIMIAMIDVIKHSGKFGNLIIDNSINLDMDISEEEHFIS